jgi:hypothetical protein
MTSEATPNFEVVIEDIALKVGKLKVLPSIITAHAEKLKTTNAKHPFTRTEVRLISIAAEMLKFERIEGVISSSSFGIYKTYDNSGRS